MGPAAHVFQDNVNKYVARLTLMMLIINMSVYIYITVQGKRIFARRYMYEYSTVHELKVSASTKPKVRSNCSDVENE